MRDTFSDLSQLTYRVKAAASLLRINENTLRGYADTAGIEVKRADTNNKTLPASRLFSPETVFDFAQYRRSIGSLKTPDLKGRPITITTYVLKGGVGKTTTSAELAVNLQLLGLRCLLVDLDVQGNATMMMGYEPDLTLEEKDEYELSDKAIVTDTMATVMRNFLSPHRGNEKTAIPVGIIKKPFGENGPHLIPSDTYADSMESDIFNAKGHRALMMRRLIDHACAGEVPGFDLSGYDVIIFDCPPSVSFTATAALAAADIAIAPIKLDAFSVKGLNKLIAEIHGLNNDYSINPELVILPTHRSTSVTRTLRMQNAISPYEDHISPISISLSEEFPKSLSTYIPLSLVKPSATGSHEYRQLADFIHSMIMRMAETKKSVKKEAA